MGNRLKYYSSQYELVIGRIEDLIPSLWMLYTAHRKLNFSHNIIFAPNLYCSGQVMEEKKMQNK